MKYEQKILAHGTKYVGYLLQDGELVYFTEELDTPQQASKQLSRYFLNPNQQKTEKPQKTQARTVANSTTNRSSSVQRSKCCGRN